MALSFNRIRVQNALVSLAMNGKFYRVAYDPTTHQATPVKADGSPITDLVADKIAPAAAVAGEVGSQFADAITFRRGQALDRTSWTFELHVRFQEEVVLEAFEEACMTSPLILPRDSANGMDRQVTLKLRNSVVQQPIQQEESTGTKVVYTFEALVSKN